MARPLLPPRGVYIPTRMIYNLQMSPALILTWIQLRGLAWSGKVTPPLRLQELAALTGKCQATNYGHMSQLRAMSALSWRSTGQGTIIVAFPDKPSIQLHPVEIPLTIPDLPIPDSTILDSAILESARPPSLSPLADPDLFPFPEDQEQDEIRESDPNDEKTNINHRRIGGGEEGSKFHESGMISSNLEFADPVTLFRSLANLTPNLAQRNLLNSKVSDILLWEQTVEHWLGHDWNPRNLTGMLDLYARGGPPGCRYCNVEPHARQEEKTAQEYTREALEDLRRELGKPSHPAEA